MPRRNHYSNQINRGGRYQNQGNSGGGYGQNYRGGADYRFDNDEGYGGGTQSGGKRANYSTGYGGGYENADDYGNYSGGRYSYQRHGMSDRTYAGDYSDDDYNDDTYNAGSYYSQGSSTGSSPGAFGDWQTGGHRGKGPKNYSRSDERISEDVNDRLSDNDQLDASEIEVTVENGEITLSGTVNSRSDKRLAEDIAESVSGVKNVQNSLRVGRQNTENITNSQTRGETTDDQSENRGGNSSRKSRGKSA